MNIRASSFRQAIVAGIIDEKRLLELCELDDGSPAFAMTLVEDFELQKESFFSDLDSSLCRKDLPGVGRLAHKLKSSLANIAAGRAAQACADLENKVTAGPSIDTVAILVENLKSEISAFLNAIR